MTASPALTLNLALAWMLWAAASPGQALAQSAALPAASIAVPAGTASDTPALARKPLLAPFSAATTSTPPPPWRVVGLPRSKTRLTQFDLVSLDDARVLRLQTDRSYGTLVHELPPTVPGAEAKLQWRWRLEQAVAGADLRRKEGDDAALKVCVMFDMPLANVPFIERSVLRLARSASSELLPAATVCYVWDPSLARGTTLPNAYTRRLRYLVVDGAQAPMGQWRSHERRIGADFLQLFGDETSTVPPVVAIIVGADADSTAGTSLGYIGDLTLTP